MEMWNTEEILRGSLDNPDIEGLLQLDDGSWSLDLRLTPEAIERRGLSPRTADLGLVCPTILTVSNELLIKVMDEL